MGEGAGVPIEPDEQTKLADATTALPGVIAAGVPGGARQQARWWGRCAGGELTLCLCACYCVAAGGFDALFAIMISDAAHPGVREAVEELWLNSSR